MVLALTVALPTYNRAEKLDRQLAWLASALQGHEHEVEVIVSDNCSTDATPEVVRRWQARLGRDLLSSSRHAVNIGAVRNIASCIRAARAPHVWVISDDDRIDDRAPKYVLETLRSHPALALLALNFSSRHVHSGRLLFPRCFPVDGDTVHPNGRKVFERCVAPRKGSRWGGMALTTALVYRTDLVNQALDAWPRGLDNLVVQLYWTGYCAVRGATLVTEEPLLECAAGDHHFHARPETFLKLRSADAAEVFARLAREGVDARLMLRKIVERPGAFARMLPDCARRDPGQVTRLLLRYSAALTSASFTVATR